MLVASTHKSMEGSATDPTKGEQRKTDVSAGIGGPGTISVSTISSAPSSSNVSTSSDAQQSLGTSSSTVAPTTTDGLSSTNFLTPGIEQYLNHFRTVVLRGCGTPAKTSRFLRDCTFNVKESGAF